MDQETGKENTKESSKSPPLYSHHNGSFRDYIQNKNLKLERQGPLPTSQIFSHVKAYITGYTGGKVSDLELKRLIQSNGGKVIPFFSKGAVTHVVCTNLAASKAKEFSKSSTPLKIVSPDWILDSVNQGKALSESKYAVLKPAAASGGIKSFLVKKKSTE